MWPKTWAVVLAQEGAGGRAGEEVGVRGRCRAGMAAVGEMVPSKGCSTDVMMPRARSCGSTKSSSPGQHCAARGFRGLAASFHDGARLAGVGPGGQQGIQLGQVRSTGMRGSP